jgi:hypothetical protein
LVTVTSNDVIPRIITAWGPPCNGTLDTSKLKSFSDKYRIAIICTIADPRVDIMSTKDLVITNLFEIPPDGLTIVLDPTLGEPANNGQPLTATETVPAATPQTPSASGAPPTARPPVTINYFAVLLPKDIERDKITTLGDVEKVGGKILDPRYYK